MSASQLRAAITAWLQPPAVPGLTRVYPAFPVFAPGQDWRLEEGQGSGAVGYVHLAQQRERRITIGGEHGGTKQVMWQVALVLVYRHLLPSSVIDSGEDTAAGWAGPYDRLIDAVCERLRADRTLGTGGAVVWQAAEGSGDGAGDDLVIDSDLPAVNAGQVVQFTAITFTAIQMINP